MPSNNRNTSSSDTLLNLNLDILRGRYDLNLFPLWGNFAAKSLGTLQK